MDELNGRDQAPVPLGDKRVRAAVVGVGNCASSLVQDRCYYSYRPEGSVHVGPSDHVPWLEDRKFCHIPAWRAPPWVTGCCWSR